MDEQAHVGVPKAIVDDLRHSGLFSEIVFLYGDDEGRRNDVDLVLTGELKKADYMQRCAPYYILGFAGPPLELIGLPGDRATREELDIDLTLRKSDTDEVVWRHSVRGEHKQPICGLWWGNDFQIVDGKAPFLGFITRLLKQGMAEAIKSMDQMIREKGDAYWLALAQRRQGIQVADPVGLPNRRQRLRRLWERSDRSAIAGQWLWGCQSIRRLIRTA